MPYVLDSDDVREQIRLYNDCYMNDCFAWKPKDDCEKCGGTGRVLTDFGESILEMVRDNLHIKVK